METEKVEKTLENTGP